MNETTKGHKNYLYPWFEWLYGEPTLIKRGEDYQTLQESMTVLIRIRAAKLGVRVSVYSNWKNGDIKIIPRGPRV